MTADDENQNWELLSLTSFEAFCGLQKGYIHWSKQKRVVILFAQVWKCTGIHRHQFLRCPLALWQSVLVVTTHRLCLAAKMWKQQSLQGLAWVLGLAAFPGTSWPMIPSNRLSRVGQDMSEEVPDVPELLDPFSAAETAAQSVLEQVPTSCLLFHAVGHDSSCMRLFLYRSV